MEACRYMGIRPPGVKDDWDEMGAWAQAQVLAFVQIAKHDAAERDAQMMGAGTPHSIPTAGRKGKRKRR